MGLKSYRRALAKAAHSGIARGKAKMGGLGFTVAKFGTAVVLAAASKNSSGWGGISALRADTVGLGLLAIGYAVSGVAFKKHQRLSLSMLEGAAIATVVGLVYRSNYTFVSGEDGRIYVAGVGGAPPPKKQRAAPPRQRPEDVPAAAE